MKRVMALGATVALLVAPVLVRLLKAQSPPQGSATHFAVLPPALANVGSVFNLSITAFDQSNNAAKSYTGTVHFTSTDPQAVLPPDYTFTTSDSGTHMFSATLNTPGTQTITGTDTANGAITGMSNPITVSATPPPPPPTFALTDLGPLQISAAPSGATALNASGQVTGFRFENFPSPACFAAGANRAFLWNNGAYTELGTLGTAPNLGASSSGYGINGVGQIVGSSESCPNGNSVGQRAFIWQNGSMTSLDPSTNSNDSSVALSINSNGDVAGYLNHANAPVAPQAVIWKGGTAAGLTVLAPLGCQFTACQAKALAINDSGQAAGSGMGPFVSGPAGSYNASQAVMWDTNGQSTGLGSLGNFWNDQANAINSKGDVAGYSQLDPGVYPSIIRAVLWPNGNPQNPQDLGTIPGIDPIFGTSANITDNSSGAWGINSKGEIVGISGLGSSVIMQGNGGRAFLYIPSPTQGTPGTMYDLLSLLAPGTNWRRLEAAWAINDNGQILGVGIDANQQEHGFLLTPIITPTAVALTSTVNPSVFSQQVSFTATVTPTQSSALAPTGNVTFSDGTTVLGTGPLSSGSATFNVGTLGVGSHTITASYAGNNNFGSSTSTALIQTVSQATTTTTLVVSPNPSNLGQSVTLMGTVTVVAPGSSTLTGPTGTVTFSDGPTSLGTILLNGAASAAFSTSSLASGSHSITATYGGDANFSGSTTASSVTVTVQGPPPPAQIVDNETIHVADAASFPDVFDPENVKVMDAITVTPLINVAAPVSEFSEGTLGFGGQSGSQTITVSDIGRGPLTLSSAIIFGSSQFTITQVACSSGATSASTSLPSGGACVLTIGYSASATPANDSGTLVFTDNAALSNVASVPSGSNYTQSIPLNGSGTSTAPPPPPPAVVPVIDNETIHVADTETFPDVFDGERVHIADAVFITPLIQVVAPVAQFSAGALGFSGQGGSQTITVSDIGTTSLTLSSATISGGSKFAVTQIACSSGATSASTTLLSGGVCMLTIGYSASATPANDNGTLVFTDNAALSNLASVPSGSNYAQTIALSGSGNSTPPPPPPPAVIPIPINETIHVTDTESFPDVFDPEQIHVTDQVSVIPCDFTISGSSPMNVPVASSGSTPITISSANGCNLQVSLSTSAANSGITISLPSTATTNGSSTSATLTVSAGPSVTPTSFNVIVTGTSGLTHLVSVNVNVTASISGTTGVVQTLLNAGAISSAGVANALTSKLSAAQSAPNAQTSINTVKAFQNQVQAQAGKSISTSFTLSGVTFNPANTLMGDGQGLINAYRAGMVPDPITGYVVNASGVGVAGATVTISDANGNVVASATTDITGFYFMATTGVLTAGANYTLQVSSLPAGFTSATPPSQSFTWQGVAAAFSNFILH